MDTTKGDEFVCVAIRVRPLTIGEDNPRSCIYQISSDPPVMQVADRSFSFDNIFTVGSEQLTIYNETVKPLVENVIKGYNCTVFAYGQTGTGKTYTMGTDPEMYGRDAGLISRTLLDILSCNDENQEVSVQISFCEIYNEKVYDLLSNSKTALQLKGFNVHGLLTRNISDVIEAEQLLFEGGKQRHTGETKQNSNSSRSHAIFTIYCNIKQWNREIKSKLNLVDLAGSESVKKTGNEGNQLFEGININKGLLCIGQVINALSCNQVHIPYRQSTITTVLKDSLTKRNFVTLIACVSQHIEDMHETLQTLEFAQRAKRLKSKPQLNTPRLTEIMLGRCKPTPRFVRTVSSRKRLAFKTPLKCVSTTVLPRHSTNSSQMDHVNFTKDTNSDLSAASTINDLPCSISPIVNRCIDAVESRILEKMENILRQSRLMTPLKPSTPKLSWHDVRNEVTRTVRKEIEDRLTAQTFRTNGSVRDTDCHNDTQTTETEVETPSRLMDFDNASPIVIGNENGDTSALFKIPAILPKRRTRLKTSSPILNKPIRRSMRLSLKKCSPRSNRSSTSQRGSMTVIQETPAPVPKPRIKLLQRRSHKVAPVPTPRKVSSNAKTSVSMGILEILNTGTVSELVKLNTVGVKTAMTLIRYRELKGKFDRIADVENVPWRGKGYERFLRSNFLEDV